MLRKLGRVLLIAFVILLAVTALAAAASAVANSRLPRASADPQQLNPAEQARVAEFFHAQNALGDRVWPGFGRADIPVVLYNETTVFLVGPHDPVPGWQPMPNGRRQGGAWEPLPDGVEGLPAFRQPLPASGATPQSFTVRVGDQWAASLTTLEWMRIGLADEIRSDLPPAVAAVFPFSLFLNQLVSGSDQFISLIAHEAFHAFQGQVAPERLAAAEAALSQEGAYPWDETSDAWAVELDLLASALQAETDEAAKARTAEFLAARTERRATGKLSAAQVDFEQQREWLEGLARYAELAIWREAAADPDYRPVAALSGDPDFDDYRGYSDRWEREIDQMRRMAGQPGEGRLYYSGMAIAMLLDRVQPDWKDRAFDPGITLDGLLAESVAGAAE